VWAFLNSSLNLITKIKLFKLFLENLYLINKELDHLKADVPDRAFHFDADPDPTPHFDGDPDPTFNFDANPSFPFDAEPDPHQKRIFLMKSTESMQVHIPLRLDLLEDDAVSVDTPSLREYDQLFLQLLQQDLFTPRHPSLPSYRL
jgi:hypothetical protein